MSSIVPTSPLQLHDPHVLSISAIRSQVLAAHTAASMLTQHSVAVASDTIQGAYMAMLLAELSEEEWLIFEMLTRDYLASMRYTLTDAYREIGTIVSRARRDTAYLFNERR